MVRRIDEDFSNGMTVRILYKKWSVANKQQYDPIARFWNIVEQYVSCTKLYGFGYGWNNDEFMYGIIFRSGLTQEVIDAVKKEFPDIKYNDTFSVPAKSSYDRTYTGKSEHIQAIYDKIWSKGPLSCELEEFEPNGKCRIYVIYKSKHK